MLQKEPIQSRKHKKILIYVTRNPHEINFFFVSFSQPASSPPLTTIEPSVQKLSQTILHRRNADMPKPRTESGEKNLISKRLAKLRQEHHMSQRDLANKLQLAGYDMDKNVITRIETNKRYVSDLELKAIAEIFQVSYVYLIDGEEE